MTNAEGIKAIIEHLVENCDECRGSGSTAPSGYSVVGFYNFTCHKCAKLRQIAGIELVKNQMTPEMQRLVEKNDANV